jgi:hypothetical protein
MPGNDPKIRSDPASWTLETHEGATRRRLAAMIRQSGPGSHPSDNNNVYAPATQSRKRQTGRTGRLSAPPGAIRLIVCIYTPENGG